MGFKTGIPLTLSRRLVANFFRNLETWFRLNPEWEVRVLADGCDLVPGKEFRLEVCYDRSEREAKYLGRAEEWRQGEGFTLLLDGDPPRRIRLTLQGNEDMVSALVYEELGESPVEPRQQTELVLWLKSTADYLNISSRPGWHWRALRFLIERLWLRLNPTGRRVVFLILVFELAGLALLIGLLMVQAWL